MKIRPEILAPAGNLEKLKIAISYGADAVYLSGQNFGLRSASDNFTDSELIEGVQFTHSRHKKAYLTLNGFLHDRDLEALKDYVGFVAEIGIDAVIVSDLGVLKVVRKQSKLPIHLSTQASCLNSSAAKVWKEMGVSRVVVGRELSIKEASRIGKHNELEIEMFAHGSMCIAYSGNCLISNFTSGRDSNRGGCAHSCRFEYSLDHNANGSFSSRGYYLSSKDLCGIDFIPEFCEAGISSLKIEGRMKSNMYAGTTAKIYQQAVTDYMNSPALYSSKKSFYFDELMKLSHREYCCGSLTSAAGEESIYDERQHEDVEWSAVGQIIKVTSSSTWISVKKAFEVGQHLEVLTFDSKNIALTISQMRDVQGELVHRSKPGTIVVIDKIVGALEMNLIRAMDTE